MQLSVCKHGIWNDDGKCRISLVLFALGKYDYLHRCVSICADNFFEQWSINYNNYGNSVFDEQQTGILQPFLLDVFRDMGGKKLYMIHTMTDETYAVNCSIGNTENKKDIMFFVALFSRCYWMLAAVLGGVIGQVLPFDLEGIDFCMTALFVIIFMEQWEKSNNHFPAVIGFIIAILCLFIFG